MLQKAANKYYGVCKFIFSTVENLKYKPVQGGKIKWERRDL
jgi:hypothetical protein